MLAIALALSTPAALGATITVNNAGSGSGGVGECTLTDAVTAANTDAVASGSGCTAGSVIGTDLILFDSTLSGSIIDPGAELELNSNLTIDGSTNGITVSGSDSHRVFSVSAGANVTLNHLTISNGNPGSGTGGGIYKKGTLTVQDSTLSGNSASSGGGLFSYEDMYENKIGTNHISNSVIANSTGGAG